MVRMSDTDFVIRRADTRDVSALGRLGALLLRTHYDFDSQRFLAPRPDSEHGYAWFLGAQLDRDDAVVYVAERDGHVVGYVYAGIEPLSWKELRDEAGFIHDVYVDDTARGLGIATALLEEAARWLADRGVPRVLLWTAAPNVAAQRLFARMGFRQTMIEMTREA
jgi:ribosomal protein S18 acetylase RimI-like enzyme